MRYDGILLVSDIDSTLAVEGAISSENVKAIRYFIENGGKFTLATGRTPHYIEEHYRHVLPLLTPVAAINGAAVKCFVTGDVKLSITLPDDYSRLLDAAQDFVGVQKIMGYTLNETVVLMPESRLPSVPYHKLLFVCDTEQIALRLQNRLKKEFSHSYEIERSWDVGVEVNHKAAGKGNAVQQLKSMTGASLSIGIGNYENDASLLLKADLGIAVKNAIQSIKDLADVVTVSAQENAISEVIYHLEEYKKYAKHK